MLHGGSAIERGYGMGIATIFCAIVTVVLLAFLIKYFETKKKSRLLLLLLL